MLCGILSGFGGFLTKMKVFSRKHKMFFFYFFCWKPRIVVLFLLFVLFVFDFLLNGSRPSMAFTVNNDSMLPIKANITTYLIKAPVLALITEKSTLKFNFSVM